MPVYRLKYLEKFDLSEKPNSNATSDMELVV